MMNWGSSSEVGKFVGWSVIIADVVGGYLNSFASCSSLMPMGTTTMRMGMRMSDTPLRRPSNWADGYVSN